MNMIQKRAFILGYLYKEAVQVTPKMFNPTGSSNKPPGKWDSVTKPITKAIGEGTSWVGEKFSGGMANTPAVKKRLNKLDQTQASVDKGLKDLQSTNKRVNTFMDNPVMKDPKKYLDNIQRDMALGFSAAPLATMGTGLIRNMADNRRHAELMKAMSRLRGRGTTPAQAAFRLQSGQNKTRNYYGG